MQGNILWILKYLSNILDFKLNRFRQRVGDIAFWKTELDGKLAGLKDLIDDLDSQRIRVEQALDACTEPLSISEQVKRLSLYFENAKLISFN